MKKKSTSARLTPAELELMHILWGQGPATVQMVVDRLPKGRDLAYTTVQTMLNVLEKKGKVRRKLDGRAYHYHPVLSRASAARQAIRDLVGGLFGGSAEDLVLAMVETRQLSGEKLRELNELVDRAERRDAGKDTP